MRFIRASHQIDELWCVCGNSSRKRGLVHISKLDEKRVEKVEDVVSVGDELLVKVLEIDSQGRINLSRKDAIADLAKKNN